MIRIEERREDYPRFKENIWAADLAKREYLSSINRGVKYLLGAIDVFPKYACVKPLEDTKAKTVLHGVIETVNESKRKLNKLWVDQKR